MTDAINGKPPVRADQTPETYLGTKRASNFRGSPGLIQGSNTFTPAKLDRTNDWTLGGKWNIDSEGITAEGDSTITIQFAAKDLYLVTANDVSNKKLGVKLNGTPISSTGSAGDDVKDSMVSLSSAQLYKLVRYNSFKKGDMLELQVPAGVKLNVFTFGS